MSTDRNLLFGILAVQMDFVSRDALIAAMSGWVLAKHRPLGEILVEQEALSAANRDLLEALVSAHIRQHDDDPARSLAALSSPARPPGEALRQVDDPDVRASIGHVTETLNTISDPNLIVAEAEGARPRFRILRPHAKGGLGEVFVAHDEELNRAVALKEIQAQYAGNRDSCSRFLLEAEITGRLEHPGIVPVYGLGRYADGRPYYAMRFVEGENLRESIQRFHGADKLGRDPRERRLAFRELLGRFVSVCNAVAFAHSRGVLHRDLKPSNVMLGRYGETLIVDWGLAKIAGKKDKADASDSTMIQPGLGTSGATPTRHGSALGTPAFMSPEQAEGQLDRLGPGSDVYSLGATLYTLLTGKAPVEGTDMAEVLQKVRRGDITPSHQAKPETPPALDAVCRKAMALRPEDRYGSATALALDVEKWLADENDSEALRAQKETAEANEKIAKANEIKAKEREAETQAVLDFLESKIFASARPEGQYGGMGSDITLRRAIEAALPFVEHVFRQQPLIEARLRMTLGTSFYYLGDVEIAADQFSAARTIYARHLSPDDPRTLMSTSDLATSYSDLGCIAEALELREEVVELCKAKLGLDHPHTLMSTSNLATSYSELDRHAEALALRQEVLRLTNAGLGPEHPDTLKSMNNLANSYSALGRHADALRLEEGVLKLLKEKAGPEHPDTLKSMNNLAASYSALGRHTEALVLWEETLRLRKSKLGPDHPDTLSSMGNLAVSYSDLGRLADALRLEEEVLRQLRDKVGREHPRTIRSMSNLATSYFAAGRHVDALELNEQVVRLRKDKLGPDHPDTLASMNNLANSYSELGRHADALKLNEEAMRLMQTKLGPEHSDTITSMVNLAASYSDMGRHVDALRVLEEVVRLRENELGPDHPYTLLGMWGVAASRANVQGGDSALPVIDECLRRTEGKHIHPLLVPGLLHLRLRLLAKCKDAAGCRTTADMWEKLGRSDAVGFYNAACNRAVIVAVLRAVDDSDIARKETTDEADLAMRWLQKAIAAGYNDIARVNEDQDLNALRDRDDFTKLVTDLVAKVADEKK
jgi:serine/threonine protein kinase